MAYSSSPIVTLGENLGVNGGTSSAIDTTGCDILIVHVASFGETFGAPTFTDSKSNSWTALTVHENVSARSQIYYCVAPTVGSGHTFALSGSLCFGSVTVAGFSGAKQTSPLDAEAGAGSGTGTSYQPGTVTPSEDNELVVSAIAVSVDGPSANDPTIDGGFTIAAKPTWSGGSTTNALAYLVQTSAAAANPTWSWAQSSRRAGTNACFKAAAVVVAYYSPPRMFVT